MLTTKRGQQEGKQRWGELLNTSRRGIGVDQEEMY